MLTFVCVHWGEKFGLEYVERLYNGLDRNVAGGIPRVRHGLESNVRLIRNRLVCLTNRPVHHAPWDQVVIPDGSLTGWWWKLYLFSREFRAHVPERFTFLDLDTVIVGPVDFFGEYRGRFAMLRDMYRNPRHHGSGVMLLGEDLDFLAPVWDDFKWPPVGRNVQSGDQFWITHKLGGMRSPSIDLIQNVWPEKVVSYKANVNPGWRKWRGKPGMPDGVVPDDASVVCFHGPPMPERVADEGWMKEHWK